MAPKKKPVKQKKSPSPKKTGKKPLRKPVYGKPKQKKRAKPVKAKQPKSLYLYNKISHDLAEYNKSLRDADKIPYALRKKIAKDILAHFKGLPKRAATYKAIREYIEQQLSEFDSSICDPRTIDASKYALIPFYDLDAFMGELPDCVDVRVNAGQYGDTGIFNTADYNYAGSGCKAIVDTLEPFHHGSPPNCPQFEGKILVKPNRQDDNNKTSYYLEMQVIMNEGEPAHLKGQGKEVAAKQISKKERAERKLKEQAKKLAQEKIKELTKKTPKTKREIVFREEPKKEKVSKREQADLLGKINTYVKNMQDLYKQGLISKKDMQAAMRKAVNLDIPSAPVKPAKRIALPIPKKAAPSRVKSNNPIPPQASRFLFMQQAQAKKVKKPVKKKKR